MTENLKSAIENLQNEEGKKRAILVIATEEKETKCETNVAVIGSGKLLVEAVKRTKMEDGVAAKIFNEADMGMLLEKLCR